ncbi:molybdopterin oxidoreductase family protein [Halalkalibacter sp. APA_J-10(15)]|uniref:assimilatory nitrate reductase catalytic subunit NasC n=1 Tax=Halalkalibacter sp. APA_J-10(15) TaxID=2933805 RepID=UPI001FF14BA3|nr:nitrate reductase [Halalkalibacter sp. APA_J-10(15)]MCK0471847.1 nitrate reductase [Halalkalibacter sp. APA_J-10(15)]
MAERLVKYSRAQQKDVQDERSYDAQCPYCSMQCKMRVIEQKGPSRTQYKTIALDNPTSEGRLCVKGIHAYQHAVHRERVKQPLFKVDGQFVPVSWEFALAVMKEKFTKIQEEFGTDAVSVYGGGSLTNEEAYLLGKFARVALKTKYIDYNGRFCMSAAASAANQAFGIDRGLTNRLDEIEQTDCIILAGTNIAECQPTIMPYFERAKENGTKIIVIDPRVTETSKMADWHIQLKPGTDAALANGLLKLIIEHGYIDEAFLSERTTGFDEVMDHVQSMEIESISTLTDVSVEQLEKVALTFGKAERAMIFTARGVEQQTDGYMAVRNFLNLLLATGSIGKLGCGYGAITGQGNGQGGREHGQKADQLPGYRSIENKEHRQYIADVWGVNEEDLPRKGVSAYEMMEKIHEGEIKAMFIMGSNPIVSNPNATYVKEALEKLSFIVSVDMFISESGKLADLILPTTSYLEDEGTMTNVEGRVMLRPASKEKPGETKHDWEILCEVAGVLGKEKYFAFHSAEQIFDELRVASRGGIADYYGITYERLREGDGIFWPCPTTNHSGTERLFEEKFYHQDKKAKLMAVSNTPAKKKESTSLEFPLYLTTGRVVAHYLTGVQTRRSSSLAARDIESHIQIHPETADKYGIEEGRLVKIRSERGEIVVRSRFSTDVRFDTVFVPFHWAESQNINDLISNELDPTCRMPGFKIAAVHITMVT